MKSLLNAKCPQCGHFFELNESLKQEIRDQLKLEVQEWKARKEEEFKRREEEQQQHIQKTLQAQELQLTQQITQRLSFNYENEIKLLKDTNAIQNERIKTAQQRELDILKKEQDVILKEQQLQVQIQATLNTERLKIIEQAQKTEEEKSALKFKELEKQREDYKRLAEEMQRKLEQGSMQLQGEVMELALEALLRSLFPFDHVEEVPKGVKGADCILHIRNPLAQACGSIIFESKRTKQFSTDWIDKLKDDQRLKNADLAVLVTEALPKDYKHMNAYNGIWICTFQEVKPLVTLLRDSLLRIHAAQTAQNNRGDKMQMLYTYLTSNEFKLCISAIAEGFKEIREGITRERMQMEKHWKEREKVLDRVLQQTMQFYGSVKGIAGNAIDDIPVLE
jgi:hypothetical protein